MTPEDRDIVLGLLDAVLNVNAGTPLTPEQVDALNADILYLQKKQG